MENAKKQLSFEVTHIFDFIFYLLSNLMLVNAAEREVQRILLELLNQMDDFDQHVNVKIRMYVGIIKWWGLVLFNP